jgi:hypothetical protein
LSIFLGIAIMIWLVPPREVEKRVKEHQDRIKPESAARAE